jgi:hypothetical protein
MIVRMKLGIKILINSNKLMTNKIVNYKTLKQTNLL